MKYIPIQQIKEFLESARNLPEQYRKNSFEDNSELNGRIFGLMFTAGAPAVLGWQIGDDISDYFKLGQAAKISVDASTSLALAILYAKSLGYTTVDKFGDWGRNIGGAAKNLKHSLGDLVSRVHQAF